MDKDKPFNLFGQASRRLGGQPLSSASSKQSESPPKLLGDDLQEMMAKMKKMHDELDRKLDEAYQKTGWTHQGIKNYLENPNNFRDFEWDRVQRERKGLLSQIWKSLGNDASERFQKSEKKKEGDKAAKGRKGKTLGGRRKWIPMQ